MAAAPAGGCARRLLVRSAARALPAARRQDGRPSVAALGELREASFADKEAIVERLWRQRPRRARGRCSPRCSKTASSSAAPTSRSFIAKSADDSLTSLELVDPLTLKPAGIGPPRRRSTKIGTNNRLRRSCKTAVARFDLSSPDPPVRLAAVTEMLRSLDEPSSRCCGERVGVETDAGGQGARSRPAWRWPRSTAAIAKRRLDGDRHAARPAAARTCATGSPALLENGSRRHASPKPTPTVRQAAADAVRRIDRRARSTRASRRCSSA